MKTKNTYNHPLEEKYIQKIITKAPGHIIYTDKNAKYDVTKAVDFICDEGIPVKVVLDGEVIHVTNSVKKNYPIKDLKKEMGFGEKEGNFIAVKHANGEFSQYSHLRYKRILVKKGRKVKTGEVIAYSGNTGLSLMPHLHFMVFRFTKPEPAKDFETLEIRWGKI